MEIHYANQNTGFISGGGETGKLIRAKDWSRTALGKVETWPQSLKTTLSLLLNSKFPMFLLWGPELICFYNDAFRPSLGNNGKHPDILGGRGEDYWSEIWSDIKPLIDQVMAGGEATWSEDQLLPIFRNNAIEDVYWTYSYSPVIDETGKPGGVFVTCSETTGKVNLLKSLEKSKRAYLNNILQAPVAMCVFKGENHVVDVANRLMLELWEKTLEQVINLPIFDALPEAREQGLEQVVDAVFSTGERFEARERPVVLMRNGKLETTFINFTYEALRDTDETITGIVAIAQDVTLQVLARKKIEESEQRFQGAVAAVQGVLWTNNARGEMEGDQPGWASLTGQSREEYQGYGWSSAVHPEDAQSNVDAWNISVRDSAPFVFEHRVRKKDGVWGTFSIRAIPLLDPDGKVREWVGVHTDVTAQREAQTALIDANQRLELTLQYFPAATFLFNAQRELIYLNDKAAKFYGDYTVESLLAEDNLTELIKKSADSYDWFNEQGEWVPREAYSTVIAFSTLRPVHSIRRLVHRQTKTFSWQSIYAIPFLNSEGNLTQLLSASIDITDQKASEEKIRQSEARFRTLAEALPHLVWVTDEKGNAEFASVRWEAYSGIDPQSEDAWRKTVHPDDYDRINEAFAQSLASGQVYKSDVRLRNKTGEYRWHSVVGEPVFDLGHKIVKWVGAFTDTHFERMFRQELERQVENRTGELARANRATGEKNKELEKKNKELQSFTYVSSHDLQEPLRKIQTFADRVIKTEGPQLSEKGKEMLSRMRNSAARMQQLIDDLLAFSRVDVGERVFVETGLKEIVNEVTLDFQEELQQKKGTVQLTETCRAQIIPFQFRQLVHNLIGNALKFSRAGVPPVIQIKSRSMSGGEPDAGRLDPHIKYCHISVEDNGIGFEPEYSERIFEVFQRLHDREAYSGTGVGLAIVKKIVDNHQGIIIAHGAINKGAAFDIYIPASPND